MTGGLVESYKSDNSGNKIIVLQVKRNFDLHHRIRVKQKNFHLFLIMHEISRGIDPSTLKPNHPYYGNTVVCRTVSLNMLH